MNEPFEKKNAEYFQTKADYVKMIPMQDDEYLPPLRKDERTQRKDISSPPKCENFEYFQSLPAEYDIQESKLHYREDRNPEYKEKIPGNVQTSKDDPFSGNKQHHHSNSDQTENLLIEVCHSLQYENT